MARRVVVTGIGLITPVGNSVDAAWDAVIAGRHGFSTVPALAECNFGGVPLPVTLGGATVGYDPELAIDKKEARRMDPFIQYTMSAAHEAWQMAGMPDRCENAEGERGVTLIGVGLAGVQHILDVQVTIRDRGPRRVSPLFIPSVIGNLAPGYVGMKYNVRGANWTPASAGASGAHAIGEGFEYIMDGRADFVVAGGSESVLSPLVVAGFANMGALTTEKDAARAVRPFDAARSGTLLGEGGGVLILEELERAKARGAKILAELVGYGNAHDGNNVSFDPNGEGMTRAMKVALDGSGIDREQVGHINANATGTVSGDRAEAHAYHAVFGPHTKNIAVSSTKSMTGEMLGASGAVEAAFTVLSLARGAIPPTAGFEKAGDGIDLDIVHGKARTASCTAAMSVTFGSGGTNTALLFRAPA